MMESVSLKQFGYNFCGPIVYSYIKKVSSLLQKEPKRVYCLAREGYFFKQAFEAFNPGEQAEYLLASRTFLFRMTINDPLSWQFSLGHAFEGTIGKFFVSRFGFTQEQTARFLSDIEFESEITLPEDKKNIEAILIRELALISDLIASSKANYLRYLQSIGLSSETLSNALLLDVGYSGTIQKLLSLLLQSNSHAFYFITTDSKNASVGEYLCTQHFAFKDQVKMGDGYTMLDRSMFLESLFTSPDGQFIDLLKSAENELIPCYGKRNYTQHHFEKLDLVFQGALLAITDYQKSNITFSLEEIESLYSLYVNSRHMLPSATWPLFEFDDAISGFGNVNSLQFFGM
ncbi:hypothetical protein [Alteromonas confluentis]|uniref:HAD family hydrolase n=1 Tax=Alteromonas confluentis TaxID=1656094 RepID=A0A1E7Z9B0_9ALTE|nr:hypothetical protein [Alteromonas confluentis]OFC70115.1 hypothetical protein BFC18_13055 [Alteromonas confluentis]